MPMSPYESLVKEYLETEGYLVYQNLKIDGKKEIDIVAHSPKAGCLVGEVKPYQPYDSKLREIGAKMDRTLIGNLISDTFGIKKFETVLFCWEPFDDEAGFRRKSKEAGFDDVVTYTQILKSMAEFLEPYEEASFYDVNRPNYLLLQIVLDAVKGNSKHFKIEDYTK